jgi:hypothetical protein
MIDLITQYTYGPILPLTLILFLFGIAISKIIFSYQLLLSTVSKIKGDFISLPAIGFFFIVGLISMNQLTKHEDARNVLASETNAITSLFNLPMMHLNGQSDIRFFLKRYLDASLKDEWKNSMNRINSPEADMMIQKMVATIYEPGFLCAKETQKKDQCTNSLLAQGYIDNVNKLSAAHNRRLELGQLERSMHRWFLCLALAFISAFTIAAIHREDKPSAMIAMIIFFITAWLALSMIALQNSPFRGPNSIQPTPLLMLQNALENSSPSK